MKQKYYVKVKEGLSCKKSSWNGALILDDVYGYEKEFDNYEDAVAAAKKTANKTKEDVIIYSIDSVVKFPEADLEVEKVV